jgi:hypothetical protein
MFIRMFRLKLARKNKHFSKDKLPNLILKVY